MVAHEAGSEEAPVGSALPLSVAQLLYYRQAVFQWPNNSNNENWEKHYRECFVDRVDGSWEQWIPVIEKNYVAQRKNMQNWLGEPCIDEADAQAHFLSKFAGNTSMKSHSIFDMLYGVRYGSMNYYRDQVLGLRLGSVQGRPPIYLEMLDNTELYKSSKPIPRQCQYAIQVAEAEGLEKDAYDLVVTVTQHSCPPHNPLFFSRDPQASPGKVEARASPNAHLQILLQESNAHVVCDASGQNQVDNPDRYVYTYKCHVVVDYWYFNHLVRPKRQYSRRLYGPVAAPASTTDSRYQRYQQPAVRNQWEKGSAVVVGHGPHRKPANNDLSSMVPQKAASSAVKAFSVDEIYEANSLMSRLISPSQHNLLHTPLLKSTPRASNESSLTSSHPDARNLTVCVTVVAILHYEAFDMFSDIFPVSLGEELYSGEHCLDLSKAVSGSDSSQHRASHMTKSPLLNSVHSTFKYFTDDNFVKKAVAKYMSVNIIGSSHARYLWDVIVNRHFQPKGYQTIASLTVKHAEAAVENFVYTGNLFVHQLHDLLMKQCSQIENSLGLNDLDKVNFASLLKTPHVYKVFVQSGAWNLAYVNILYPLLSEKKGLNSFLETVKEIANRRCSYFLDLTVMSTVPAPMPVDNNMHSYIVHKVYANLMHDKPLAVEYMLRHCRYIATCRGFRTNGALQAYSEYMQHGIGLIEYPSAEIKQLFNKHIQPSLKKPPGKLDYLDLVNILLAFNEDTVDNMHYIKVNHAGVWQTRTVKFPEVSTLAGEMLLGAFMDKLIPK
eukprot:gene24213-29282_t